MSGLKGIVGALPHQRSSRSHILLLAFSLALSANVNGRSIWCVQVFAPAAEATANFPLTDLDIPGWHFNSSVPLAHPVQL